MKIKSFSARKLHGYLSFKLEFFEDLTFLTGINGSGKTSAVRALTALLGPSLGLLAGFHFLELAVAVESAGRNQIITARRQENEIWIEHSEVEGHLAFPILKPDGFESLTRFQERQRDFYREQEALLQKNPILSAIERLPTPMFLDLERRHQDGHRPRNSAHRFAGRPLPHNPLAGSLADSLADAEALAEQNYREYLVTKNQLTDVLKQDIILTAFRPEEGDMFSGFSFQPPTVRKIGSNETIVRQSLSDLGISRERQEEVVTPFFERLRKVIDNFPTQKQLEGIKAKDSELIQRLQDWSALQPQVRQIERLADLIGKYNQQVRVAFEPIDRYLSAVNRFFADSKKRVSFDTSANLRITVTESDHSRPIGGLSSGERQLIVILTHLAFSKTAKRANILIIDEPELSLHLRWQELFVPAVIGADPEVQLILATHSPSIIGSRLDNCIDVDGARQSDRLLV